MDQKKLNNIGNFPALKNSHSNKGDKHLINKSLQTVGIAIMKMFRVPWKGKSGESRLT